MAVFVPLLALILFITTSSYACEPYDRKAWKHWIDENKDGQNRRPEELIGESLTPVTFGADKGCRGVSGSWLGEYSGNVIPDASKLDFDNLVPLQKTHESGGNPGILRRKNLHKGSEGSKKTLITVDRYLNRQYGASDPAGWFPPNLAYQMNKCANIGWSEAQIESDYKQERSSSIERTARRSVGST